MPSLGEIKSRRQELIGRRIALVSMTVGAAIAVDDGWRFGLERAQAVMARQSH